MADASPSPHPDGTVRFMEPIAGSVDVVADRILSGWAGRHGRREEPLRVEAWLGDTRIGAGRTGRFRPDLDRAFGFELDLAVAPAPAAVVSGLLRVEATDEEGNRTPLPIYPPARAAAQRRCVEEALATLPDADRRPLLAALAAAHPGALFGPAPGEADGGLSPVMVPVGLESADGSAVVGRGGQLFLKSGSNDLAGQYEAARSHPQVRADAERWAGVLAARSRRSGERGIAFRQMIVPDKSSILAESFPRAIAPPTPRLAVLEELVAGSPFAGDYVALFGPMRAEPDRAALFRGCDSHLSSAGAFLLFARLLRSLGHVPPAVGFTDARNLPGDLGVKFPGLPILSIDLAPPAAATARYERRLEVVEQVRPGRHVGTRFRTVNPDAPIRRRVLAFANSYFGVAAVSTCVAFWMARWFAEFHFVWTAEVDFDEVEAVAPDIVVGQTAERFLVTPPAN